MRKKIGVIGILEIALLAIIVALCCVNIWGLKNADFWKISIAQALTLIVAIVIAFWASQRKNDERKVKEQIEKIVEKIMSVVSSPSFTTFESSNDPEEVQKRITMNTRKLTNCIDILRAYSNTLDISGQITYIDEQIKGYRDFVSVKVGDLDYLSKSETHLIKYAENISSKCDYIIMLLYTKK